MKTTSKVSIILLTTLLTAFSAIAETTYTIKESNTYSSLKLPNPCYNCTFNLANGVTLTLDNDVTFLEVTFSGGSVSTNRNITLWSNGANNNFYNTFFTLKGAATFVASGPVIMKNSEFDFDNTASMTAQKYLEMTNSKIKILKNGFFYASGGPVNMIDYSSLTAGDGDLGSKAYIKIDGPTLNLYDNSFVTMGNKNNYYFNWNSYNSIAAGGNKSYSTKDNKINCGANGKNACSTPQAYGPATLNLSGLSANSTLPVILSAFQAQLAASNKVELTWITQTELNADHFEIERSADGRNWSTIKSIRANGNSVVAIKYAFTDFSPLSGPGYYRLNMIDIDGKAAYSPIKSVRTQSIAGMRVYPNPAVEYVVISSKEVVAQKATIQVISGPGQVIRQLNEANIAGSGVTIPVAQMIPGTYVIRVIDSAGVSQTFKLMVTK